MKEILQKIGDALAALLKVKSIITLVLLVIFSVLAVRGTVSAEQVVSVFMIIMGFYFGTQATKDNGGQLIELNPEDFSDILAKEEEEEPEGTTHAIGFALDDTAYEDEEEESE